MINNVMLCYVIFIYSLSLYSCLAKLPFSSHRQRHILNGDCSSKKYRVSKQQQKKRLGTLLEGAGCFFFKVNFQNFVFFIYWCKSVKLVKNGIIVYTFTFVFLTRRV